MCWDSPFASCMYTLEAAGLHSRSRYKVPKGFHMFHIFPFQIRYHSSSSCLFYTFHVIWLTLSKQMLDFKVLEFIMRFYFVLLPVSKQCLCGRGVVFLSVRQQRTKTGQMSPSFRLLNHPACCACLMPAVILLIGFVYCTLEFSCDFMFFMLPLSLQVLVFSSQPNCDMEYHVRF